MRNLTLPRMLFVFGALIAAAALAVVGSAPPAQAAPVIGAQKVMVLRVYFQDYTATSRYTKAEVEGFFNNLDQLWRDTSYGNMSIDSQVTDLYQLPDNRSEYVDDFATGDLSNGGKFWKVLDDAIDNAPGGLDWTNLAAIMVVMAETNASQFHRGQATSGCNLQMGPGGANASVGCAIFSENPTENDNQVWGRWAHEIGHAFQQGGPAHPSNYNNEFELMDSNYPGQTGVFEKQDSIAFPGWLPPSKYINVSVGNQGEDICLQPMEYDPALLPNAQAIKASITGSLYYLISARQRVLGDDLNGDFSPFGIPDEGILIERVSEGSDPWVTVQGKGGNRNRLWQPGDAFENATDGIFINVTKAIDVEGQKHLCVVVRFDRKGIQPDVMLSRWTQPPGNTWETTDIWIDSPANGYDTYRYGTWSDLKGGVVPRGNGDDPTVGLVNRLYARVRNVGATTATDVVATWEITDPPGLGIAGANGWAVIGSVDKNTFPGLASIPAGGFVDVYVEWTPNFAIPEEDLENGLFAFHTCVRVKLNQVAGETVVANQDGDGEQENIGYFQAIPPGEGESAYNEVIRLRNDDPVHSKFFYLNFKEDLPDDWSLDVNNGVKGFEIPPGEEREVPVIIKPGPSTGIGDIFGVDIWASSQRILVNDHDASDVHHEFQPLGGVRVEARGLRPTRIDCEAAKLGDQEIQFKGVLKAEELQRFFEKERALFRALIVGVDDQGRILPDTMQDVPIDPDGNFAGFLNPKFRVEPMEGLCMFAGTPSLASSASGYISIAGVAPTCLGRPVTIAGTPGNDNLVGTPGPDVIHGLAGDDRIDGLGGDDRICGGRGNDILNGFDGNDAITGNLGEDRINGGAGNDRLLGDEGNDVLNGGPGRDAVDGGSGDDVMNGGADADTLWGREGDDVLNGSTDNDIIDGGPGRDRVNAGDGADNVSGGQDNDVINGDPGNDSLFGDEGNDIINAGVGNDLLSGGDGNDVLRGGLDNDRAFGNDGNDVLDGVSGDDELNGNRGDDLLNGGPGHDTLNGGDNNDRLNGGDGHDALNGGDGVDLLNGGRGDDAMQGGNGNDTLNGGLGADTTRGGNGNDLVFGNEGPDKMFGEAGNDLLRGNDHNDRLDGGFNVDTLDGSAGFDTCVSGEAVVNCEA